MANIKDTIYTDITNAIVSLMEEHGTGWTKPWVAIGGPANATTGRHYGGINVLILGLAAHRKSYAASQWATFKQWKAHGYSVIKGEKATHITFYKPITVEDKITGEEKRVPLLRTFAVFNVAQVEAGDDAKPVVEPKVPQGAQAIAEVDAWIDATGAQVGHGGDKAFYSPSVDSIQMPHADGFTSTEAYYGTLLHELTHWTGASHRCDRQFGKRFGDEAYAMEELVAEIGAAFMCQAHGITQEVRADHAQYLNSWMRVLKADHKAIFTASAKAQQATEWLQAAVDGDEKVAA